MSELRRTVAELSTTSEGYAYALTYTRSELFRLASAGASAAELAEARMVLVELLQKLGRIEECRRELAAVDVRHLPDSARLGVLLVLAKLASQSGDLPGSKVALAGLKDRLGQRGAVDMNQVYLWRQAFTLGVLGDTAEARRLHDEHRALASGGGFQEANRILYAQLLPALAVEDGWALRGSTLLESARAAGTLYVESDIGFTGRLNHRGKSFCQALLTEAVFWWLLGNLFDGYRTGFVAALLLRHWQLDLRAEGIGELMSVFRERAPALVAAVALVATGRDDEVLAAGAAVADAAVPAAYLGATEVVRHVVAGGALGGLYDVLDARRC